MNRASDIAEIRAMCEERHPHSPDESTAWLAVHRLLRSIDGEDEPVLVDVDIATAVIETSDVEIDLLRANLHEANTDHRVATLPPYVCTEAGCGYRPKERRSIKERLMLVRR